MTAFISYGELLSGLFFCLATSLGETFIKLIAFFEMPVVPDFPSRYSVTRAASVHAPVPALIFKKQTLGITDAEAMNQFIWFANKDESLVIRLLWGIL